jgi:hypothetical protein
MNARFVSRLMLATLLVATVSIATLAGTSNIAHSQGPTPQSTPNDAAPDSGGDLVRPSDRGQTRSPRLNRAQGNWFIGNCRDRRHM